MNNRQYTCSYDGCGKSFARKEHLARHSKSHNPANMLECPVCGRHFNRNDSLQRHIVKHGAVFKQNPSGRSKRACLACRAGKTKCDGGDSCAKCLKRGIECKYGQENSRREDSPTRSQTFESPPPTQPVPAKPTTSKSGLFDWTAIQIVPDPQETSTDLRIDEVQARKYLDVYFAQFHDRWPIIHRPSHDEDSNLDNLCNKSMRMIGAWLLGTTESVQFAVETHNTLVDHVMSELCRVTLHDRFQQSLPAMICDAAVLNIIFAFYYGHDREMSHAIVLWNTLVFALREVDFFKPETAWADEKSGYFLALALVKREQRTRLAYFLFKLSAYISIVRNQPMTILAEELYFPIPCTFSLYNADGLDVWEERQIVEPAYRASTSMYNLINNDTIDPNIMQEQPMTIEDINFCLCAVQSDIWKNVQSGVSQSNCEVNVVLLKDSLRRQLERLNSRLDRILAQKAPLTGLDFGDEKYLPYRYYYGFEDHATLGGQVIVSARVKTIMFDTVMLYFLLSLNLSVDIRKLTQIAKDQRLSPLEELSEVHRRARDQRQTSMKGWAATPAARWAICQAVDVLLAYQNFKNDSGNARYLDPMCHAALCVSALILWTFCTFYDYGCEICVPGDISVAELTTWSMSPKQFEKEKGEWVEMGARGLQSRPQVQGIQLCRCNTHFVMALFQARLPSGWDIAQTIAPGIFRSSTI